MTFYHWKGNAFKLFGITIFRISVKKSRVVYYLFGLPIWFHNSELACLITDIRNNKNYDMRQIDQRVANLAFKYCNVSPCRKEPKNCIIYLATELYANGGHTKCLREYMSLLNKEYKQFLLLTRFTSTDLRNSSTIKSLKEYSELYGEELNPVSWRKGITSLYNHICHFSPKVIFVFIHPDDIYGAMLLSLIHRNTNISILYYPHASHYPNIGMNFANLTLHNLPVTARFTRNKRKFSRTHVLGLIGKKLEDFPIFTTEQIISQKQKFGLKENEICVMSGGSAYKFFDSPNHSEFFQTIKKLLEARSNIRVVILSDFNTRQTEWIENFFSNSKSRDRLVLTLSTPLYELAFSCADIFLDSFPVSAALTMVDLMRLRVPAVVKINKNNELWSFHEYQKVDYPYMFEKVEDFFKGTLQLIDNKSERDRISYINYKFYLSKYEGNICKTKLCRLIENHDNLDQYIDTI